MEDTQNNFAYVHPKDNEIYWSPVPKPEFNAWRDSEETEQSALKAFEDGLTVKYEDQEAIKMLMTKATGYVANDEFFSLIFFNERFKPGTCLPIDVKGEVVEQWLCKDVWLDVVDDRQFKPHTSKFQYRSVFRITK